MTGGDASLAVVGAPASTSGPGHDRSVTGRARRDKARATTPQGMIWAGLAGFVAGAVCWHFVGFWSFMTETVFYARPEAQARGVQRPGPAWAKNQHRQPGAVAVSAAPAACSLVAKGTAADVAPRSCDGHTFKFHPSRHIDRADRGDFGPVPVPTLISGEGVGVVAVGGWSARVDGGDVAPVLTGGKKAN